ncbi:MAG: phosphate ABC transporter substrate-binding protein [Sporolactobacillus sp.]
MKKKSLLALSLLLVLSLILALGACSNGSSSSSSSKSSSSKVENLSGKLTIGGSTALQPLVAQAAKEFMAKYKDVQIDVQGGGSGTGLTNVGSGTFDIGNSDIFAEQKQGVDASQLVDHKVAVVGMAAAVNSQAGVKNLTKAQLQGIFTGQYTNWNQVGGKDLKITIVNRTAGSGTRATFDQFALDGKTEVNGITQDSTDTAKQVVAQTPGAISYIAFSYFTSSDANVVKLSIDGVDATYDNVASGKYPVWSYEHMYTKGTPSKLAKAFIDYIESSAVQSKDVPAQGYYAISKMKVSRDATGKESK